MKFAFVLAFLSAISMVMASTFVDTNANRLARGLPPLPPRRRATGVQAARRSSPSGSPSQCNTGSAVCCKSSGTSSDSAIGLLLGLLGIVVGPDVLIGATCSPISLVGIGSGASCTEQPLCCENNNFNGLISVGCSPLNL